VRSLSASHRGKEHDDLEVLIVFIIVVPGQHSHRQYHSGMLIALALPFQTLTAKFPLIPQIHAQLSISEAEILRRIILSIPLPRTVFTHESQNNLFVLAMHSSLSNHAHRTHRLDSCPTRETE